MHAMSRLHAILALISVALVYSSPATAPKHAAQAGVETTPVPKTQTAAKQVDTTTKALSVATTTAAAPSVSTKPVAAPAVSTKAVAAPAWVSEVLLATTSPSAPSSSPSDKQRRATTTLRLLKLPQETRTTTPRLPEEVRSTTQKRKHHVGSTTPKSKFQAKIVDSVLVLGSLAGAAAVGGGIAAGVETYKSGHSQESATVATENVAMNPIGPVHHHLRGVGVTVVASTTPSVTLATTTYLITEAPHETIEMFPASKEIDSTRISKSPQLSNGGSSPDSFADSFQQNMPSPAWLLVFGIATVGGCLLAAGLFLACFTRRKRSSRIWNPVDGPSEFDAAEVEAASRRSREAREEFAGQSERLCEEPLLPPLPPLLPRPVPTMNHIAVAAPLAGAPVMMRYAPIQTAQTTGQMLQHGYAVRSSFPPMR